LSIGLVALGMNVNCTVPFKVTGVAEGSPTPTTTGTVGSWLGFDPVSDTGGITAGFTTSKQENTADTEFALSLNATVKGKLPAADAVPDKVVVLPLVGLRPSHDGPLYAHVYGAVPPEAVKDKEKADWNGSGDAGQPALGVITSGELMVPVQLNVAAGEPGLSVSVTENEKLPLAGGVPVIEILKPVAPLSDSHDGPDKLHP
jgi:hypothetical protein